MLIAHYAHRLPANYDISIIRTRAKERGADWNHAPDLYFKGFLLRESGCNGAIANSYSSLYLWRNEQALQEFLTTGRYNIVTDSFGRAPIHTWVVLDARRGRAKHARFAYLEELAIPLDANLTRTLAEEASRNQDAACQSDVVVATVGLDTQHWRLMRVLLSENKPKAGNTATVYEILHLAAPLLQTLEATRA